MYIEAMKKRISVRTYRPEPLIEDAINKVSDIIEDSSNPFGANLRFCLVEKAKVEGRLGTYGFIRGPKVFIAGCLKRSEKDMEGYGYAFEKAILKLTDMGLGTCWLGGTFNRGTFYRSANLKEEEILPAVTPIGYAKEKRSLIERAVAASAGARTRKSYKELFFDGDFSKALDVPDGKLKTCLDMVRIAPSASNKQPWRAVKVGDAVHFYLDKAKNYTGNTAFGFCMQRIDLGIAACHFDMAAKELGMNGSIVIKDPGLSTELEYSFTWE